MHKKSIQNFILICNNMLDNIKKDYHKISNIYILKYQICSENSERYTRYVPLHRARFFSLLFFLNTKSIRFCLE